MSAIGATYTGNGCTFSVWAPEKKSMVVHIVHPFERTISMKQSEDGYFTITLNDIPPGTRYYYRPEGVKDFPDPASAYQPEGVHGPSEVIDHNSFEWNDTSWKGIPFCDLILYELHVGTFTKEGTFEAIIPFLDDLVDTGINAIELMPIAQFPGARNWGYDGVYPYAVQNSYGGPKGLKKLVDACHQKGISVFLDVVYNHLGPEGNYFKEYAPYFTDRYCTPWGDAINFDGEYSDGVREYFSNNPLYWFEHYHIDGLRLDAIHMVFDNGAVNFWELVHNKIKDLGQRLKKPLYMIAESDLNSPRVIRDTNVGGYGFDAVWLDDFHHSLYALLDKKGKERYADFGLMEQLAKAYTDGFVHSGQYVKFRKRKHGASSAGISGDKFVVFNLNHDQVGNRVKGERLCLLIDYARLKLAAAAILVSPYVPMLFMGEEYADESPFFYFVDHSDKALIEAVQKGRREEFAAFKSEGEPPDPHDEKTFKDSKLKWHQRNTGKYGIVLRWHKKLIALRSHPIMKNFNKDNIRVYVLGQSGFVLHRQSDNGMRHLLFLFNLSEYPIRYPMPAYANTWLKQLDSADPEWNTGDTFNAAGMPKCVNARVEVNIPPLTISLYSSEESHEELT